MLGLYTFEFNFGRSGELTGSFIADSADIENIIGKHVHFGEVLGKHSEVEGVLEADNFELITQSEEVLEGLKDFNVGVNPLDYV